MLPGPNGRDARVDRGAPPRSLPPARPRKVGRVPCRSMRSRRRVAGGDRGNEPYPAKDRGPRASTIARAAGVTATRMRTRVAGRPPRPYEVAIPRSLAVPRGPLARRRPQGPAAPRVRSARCARGPPPAWRFPQRYGTRTRKFRGEAVREIARNPHRRIRAPLSCRARRSWRSVCERRDRRGRSALPPPRAATVADRSPSSAIPRACRLRSPRRPWRDEARGRTGSASAAYWRSLHDSRQPSPWNASDDWLIMGAPWGSNPRRILQGASMTDLSVRKKLAPHKVTHKVRFVTAASLFDGHDASINIMRRILQASGAEVIHLGHNRSVSEIVEAALQEDVQGIAITSYQGGHLEYFKYMLDLLRANGGEEIKVFGGGGGVIVASEMRELHEYGVRRLYSPE